MIEVTIQIFEIGPGTVGMQVDKKPTDPQKPPTPGERGLWKVLEKLLIEGPAKVEGIRQMG